MRFGEATIFLELAMLPLKFVAPVALWVGIGYYSGLSKELSLIAYIAFVLTALYTRKQELLTSEEKKIPLRDYYVVTDETYRWDLTRSISRKNTLDPQPGGMTYAFDNFEAAKIQYELLEGEHYPLELEGHNLTYHENSGFDEQETRLWVIAAGSKAEAYDKVWYHESRRLIGHDNGRTDQVLLVTDGRKRKEEYLSWWQELRLAAHS